MSTTMQSPTSKLALIRTAIKAPDMSGETIDAKQAAELLFCSEAEAEQAARDGEIPGIKFGRGWVFVKHDLIAFIAEEARAQAQQRRAKKHPAPVQMGMDPAPKDKRARRQPPTLPALPSPTH
jgi:hypothetical protein